MRERLGRRTFKVGLDARLSCPNIDGTVARGGCTFCTNPSFSFQSMGRDRAKDLKEQLRRGIERYKRTRRPAGYIAYFQTFTNTWARPDLLRELYSSVVDEPGVVGLAISTRPDALSEPVVDVLAEFAERTFVSVEVGLQTANDVTLAAINRGHTLAQFHEAMERLTARGLHSKVHLLFGLPGDGREDAIRSVLEVNRSGADGVKFHHLQVLNKTRMGIDYRHKPFPLFTFEEYQELILEVVAHLDPRLYVDRLFATCRRELVIGPHWELDPPAIRLKLIDALVEHGVTQGCALVGDPGNPAPHPS